MSVREYTMNERTIRLYLLGERRMLHDRGALTISEAALQGSSLLNLNRALRKMHWHADEPYHGLH